MARSPPQSFWEQVPGLGQELASQLRWTVLRSLKAAWKKTLVLQGEVPERAACVLCWKSLTWDAWSPGEACFVSLGSVVPKPPLAASERPRGLCSPRASPAALCSAPAAKQQQCWGAAWWGEHAEVPGAPALEPGTLLGREGGRGQTGTGLPWGSRGCRVRATCREDALRS